MKIINKNELIILNPIRQYPHSCISAERSLQEMTRKKDPCIRDVVSKEVLKGTVNKKL